MFPRLLPLAVLFAGAPALADSNSFATLGASAGFGIQHVAGPSGVGLDSLNPEFGVRLRLFHWLGAEIEVAPSMLGTGPISDRFGVRVSGLIYVVPAESFGLYAKGGVGHRNLLQLVENPGSWDSFHFGGGLEVYLGKNLAVSGEFFFVEDLAAAAARISRAIASGNLSPSTPFSLETFNASMAVRFYL